MADFAFVVLALGSAVTVLLAFSPIGRALGDRIRHRGGPVELDPVARDELARLRDDLAELQERMEFTERVLAQRNEPGRLPADS